MKKIVSLALSTAMAFSMFASVTSAATMSTQEKYDALVAQKIFEGYPDGAANLNKDVTRAEFAKVVALMTGLDVTDTNTVTYSDPNYNTKYAWYRPYTEAVTKAGYMKGTTTGAKKLFNPNGKVTVQEMAATLVRAGKLEIPTEGISNGASAWAKGEVQAAINAGLISSTANFNAAATRSLLVDTAYAYQTKVVKPAVTSYEVQDNGATVVFTLANGEKVTVKPEKALVANTATTVNFKYGEYEYSESVTWTVTDATKVVSAAATNLKEVTVTFDGKVDPASATNRNNYSVNDRNIQNVRLSEDGRVATILLEQETDATLTNTLTANRPATLTVRNIKPATGTTTITQTLTFTPADVAVPTVTEVTGLGTQAFQVTFSEPVRQADLVTANFTIDGRAVSGTVHYSYPNKAIIETPLTEGEHTVRVSGVRDYSGLSLVPTEQKFTVTADTTAPKLVSVESYDLREVTFVLDEPVKSVGGAYANVSSFTASSNGIKINGNRVTVSFPNNLNYGSNTVVLNNVRDYSGNVGSITGTVTPTLDLVAPTVTRVDFEQRGSNFFAEIQLSKAVEAVSATTLSNYVLKNGNGTVVTGNGRNAAGNPTTAATLSADGKTITLNLGTNLPEDFYTLTISGLRDRTVAGNILLPFTATLNRNQAATGDLIRTWVQNGYVYFEFNKPVATSGNGNALDPAKYTLNTLTGANTGAGVDGTYRLTTRAADIETYGANTVRIYARNYTTSTNLVGRSVSANYIADASGNYFTNQDGTYVLKSTIASSTARPTVVATGDVVVATSTSTIEVNFSAPLASVRASDFALYTTAGAVAYTATNATLSNDKMTVTLDFNGQIPANFANTTYQLRIADTSGTVDQFGNTATTGTAGDAAKIINVRNAIRPSATGTAVGIAAAPTNQYTVYVPFDAAIDVVSPLTPESLGVFSASFNNKNTAVVTGVSVVTPTAANTASGTNFGTGTSPTVLAVTVQGTQVDSNSFGGSTLTVNLNSSNADVKTVRGLNNAAAANTFTKSVAVPATGATQTGPSVTTPAIAPVAQVTLQPGEGGTIVFNKAVNAATANQVQSAFRLASNLTEAQYAGLTATVDPTNANAIRVVYDPAVGANPVTFAAPVTVPTLTGADGTTRANVNVSFTGAEVSTTFVNPRTVTALTGQLAPSGTATITFNKALGATGLAQVRTALQAASGLVDPTELTVVAGGAANQVLVTNTNTTVGTNFAGEVSVQTLTANDGTTASNVVVRTN